MGDDGEHLRFTGELGCNDLWCGMETCLALGRHSTTGLWTCMVMVTRGIITRKELQRLRRWSHAKDSCTDIHWTSPPLF